MILAPLIDFTISEKQLKEEMSKIQVDFDIENELLVEFDGGA